MNAGRTPNLQHIKKPGLVGLAFWIVMVFQRPLGKRTC